MTKDQVIKEMEYLISETSEIVKEKIVVEEIRYQGKGHTPIQLGKGNISVYCFVYNGIFLKIGQAGKGNNARYQKHHYKISKNIGSSLAKSIQADDTEKPYSSLNNPDEIEKWIIENCERYDVIIKANNPGIDKQILNFIEGMFHYKYAPRYEGRIKSNKKASPPDKSEQAQQ